ncbi:SusC/RagA family TonB-linked outer membrane protein [Parasegetibacter sp. NRK P23]|uniref:SusC/RagA family TonB-linked outer membrane protein n=1 Tax=Parasegetibacter sp. NRK P23 TaxID=2942999 RepID=UPI0020445285|nr:SusC/RagA family TonB-linked outer membrane protein [Parasegetibacter sp. NRK P23]MCM5529838.1 SusC/RagA family TonB-linked outer membrane protein [Parasegetibacter sp. NRK P23]
MLILRRNITKAITVSVMALAVANAAAQQQQQRYSDTTAAQTRGVEISGTITDAVTGKGLPSIRVQVPEFSATITGDNGKFRLRVPSYGAELLVSGEGFETRRVALKGRNTVEVALMDDEHPSLHESVVTPFGTAPNLQTTVSAAQYNVKAGWTQPGEVADAMLQGRIPGLNAIRRSGTPGAGANLFLRGYNSLYGTNKPLIIVDNMIFDANDYGESIIANNYTNPLALIDVKDIDNITVLRDASSIYGTKGANGAIIITTARAQQQATKIDFGIFTGINSAPKALPVMGAGDFRILLSEMLQGKGLSSGEIAALPYMNDDPQNPDYARYHYNTNWQDKVLKASASQNVFLKVTGGDNIATYGLSMGYMKSEGVVSNTDLTRYSTRFNAEFNFSKKFTGMANLSFAYNEQNLKDQGIADKTSPVFLSLVKSPFMAEREVNDEGIESPNLAGLDSLGIGNPSTVIRQMQAYNKYYRFFGSFGFRYAINDYFSAATMFGINYDKVRENIFVPQSGIAKDSLSNAVVTNRLGTQVKRLYSVYNDTRIEYKRNYGFIHSIASRIGMRYQKNEAEQDFALGFNSATDELVSVQNGVSALRQVGGGIGNWNWINYYFGTDYGFRNKLFLSFNMAVDGSSRFGKEAPGGIGLYNSRFAVMPSLGAAWLLSSESFMANSSLDVLRLRAGFSMAGNDDIGNYSARQTYVSQNLLGVQGLVRKGIANPTLQWETNKKLNLGVDLAFWNERVSLSLDAYQNTTDNMLVYKDLDTPTGFTQMLTNEGKMKNTGIDAALNVRVVNSATVKWDLGVNIGTYRNKIMELPGGSFTTTYAGATILTREGAAANQFYGYTSTGVFSSDAEAAAAGLVKKNEDGSYSRFMGGDIRFADLDNNDTINMADQQVIGNPNPDFTGGITSRVSWKRFELNALFTFSQGNDVFNYLRYRLESMSGLENQLISVNNRWRADGQVTNMPKASFNDPMGNNRFSNRWIEDGSYFRLRSLSVQYNIPLREGFITNASIYAIGSNLFTLTKYKGYDPEFSASPSVFAQGIDTGLDPQFRSVTLGVRIGL